RGQAVDGELPDHDRTGEGDGGGVERGIPRRNGLGAGAGAGAEDPGGGAGEAEVVGAGDRLPGRVLVLPAVDRGDECGTAPGHAPALLDHGARPADPVVDGEVGVLVARPFDV